MPCSVPSLATGPSRSTSVLNCQLGPSRSSASTDVNILSVDAGVRGSSGATEKSVSPRVIETWVHDTRGPGLVFGPGCGGEVDRCRVEQTGEPAVQVDERAHPTVTLSEDAAPMGGVFLCRFYRWVPELCGCRPLVGTPSVLTHPRRPPHPAGSG